MNGINSEFYIIEGLALLVKLNEVTNKSKWFIDAHTDGESFSMYATKDDTRNPKTTLLGETQLSPKQFFYTLLAMLEANESDNMGGDVADDVVEDYIEYVVQQRRNPDE